MKVSFASAGLQNKLPIQDSPGGAAPAAASHDEAGFPCAR